MFNIDYKRLICILLPTFLRRPVLYGLLRAAIVPLESLHDDFKRSRAGHNYRLSHNGQVCYLRACLNDSFKSSQGGVFDIINLERAGEWLFAVTEKGSRIPVTLSEGNLSPVENIPVVYNEAMLNETQNEFIVAVPADLYDSQLDSIKSMVDKYKLISKKAIYVPQSA